ncbi:hypothetical protein Tco_0474298 [Tanacetum coccineum]
MENPLPPDHIADLPEVEPAQPELASAVPEPAPLLPDHVPNFPKEDPKEEPNEGPEEEEEEFKEEEEDMIDMDLDDEIDEAEVISPYKMMGSPKIPPPKPDTSSDSEFEGLNRQMGIRANTEFLTLKRLDKGHQFMKGLDEYLRNEIHHGHRVEHRVTTLEDQVRSLVQGDREENKRLRRELEETRLSRDQVLRDFYRLRVWAHGFYGEMVRVGAIRKEGPSEAIDVVATLRGTSPHEPRGSPRDS